MSRLNTDGSLASFFLRVQEHNPFLDNRVNAPSASDADVDAIHLDAFRRLTGLADEALRAGRGLGAVLWGEAGIGKSHLLSRLARWADGKAAFLYLHNLQAAPESLPRSLLRAVISLLTRGQRRRYYRTPLFDLMHQTVLRIVPPDQRVVPWSQVERAYHSWIDRLGQHDLVGSAVVDHTPYDVLFHFFRSVCDFSLGRDDGQAAQLAVRWLSGDGLEQEEAALLGLPPAPGREQGVGLSDNQQIKEVLVALARLSAYRGQPFVLAFDQIDNLDAEQFAALARFLEALIDAAPNLLVITAGIQASLLRWHEERVIQDSAWDRLAQFQVRLQRITADEAAQIVQRRLHPFLLPFAELAPIAERSAADSYFPLGADWQRQHLQDRVDLRPRDVINWAGDGWRGLQDRLRRGDTSWMNGGAEQTAKRELSEAEIRDLTDQQIRESLADLQANRQRQPQSLPPDEDRLAQLVYDLLCQCREADVGLGLTHIERIRQRGPAKPPHQVEIIQQRGEDEGAIRTGLLFVTATSRVAVSGYIRRLLDGMENVNRQVLVTDDRIGLRLGPKGAEHLARHEEEYPNRLRRVELTFAEYAELDGLHAVVGLARSGELEVEIAADQVRTLTPAEVIESLHRQGCYLAARLLREVLQPVGQAVAP